MLPLTKEELKSHRKRILQKLTKNKSYLKVRDYFHYTGKYRGTAHSTCYLKFNMLPIKSL